MKDLFDGLTMDDIRRGIATFNRVHPRDPRFVGEALEMRDLMGDAIADMLYQEVEKRRGNACSVTAHGLRASVRRAPAAENGFAIDGVEVVGTSGLHAPGLREYAFKSRCAALAAAVSQVLDAHAPELLRGSLYDDLRSVAERLRKTAAG